jgi:hypothetical protein
MRKSFIEPLNAYNAPPLYQKHPSPKPPPSEYVGSVPENVPVVTSVPFLYTLITVPCLVKARCVHVLSETDVVKVLFPKQQLMFPDLSILAPYP